MGLGCNPQALWRGLLPRVRDKLALVDMPVRAPRSGLSALF